MSKQSLIETKTQLESILLPNRVENSPYMLSVYEIHGNPVLYIHPIKNEYTINRLIDGHPSYFFEIENGFDRYKVNNVKCAMTEVELDFVSLLNKKRATLISHQQVNTNLFESSTIQRIFKHNDYLTCNLVLSMDIPEYNLKAGNVLSIKFEKNMNKNKRTFGLRVANSIVIGLIFDAILSKYKTKKQKDSKMPISGHIKNVGLMYASHILGDKASNILNSFFVYTGEIIVDGK